MKVGLLSPTISRAGGGVAESVRVLVRALPSDFKVVVYALEDPHSAEDLGDWEGIDVRLFRVSFLARLGVSIGLARALFRDPPDVLHVHGLWMFHNLAAYTWGRILRRPYVVTPHGMLEPWILRRSPKLKRIFSLAFQNDFLRRASAFHLLTNKEKSDVANWPKVPIAVIPNYVDLPQVLNARPQWWQTEHEGRTVFLFFGRIHEKKGCLELLNAWNKVCEDLSGFARRNTLVFCGWVDGVPGFQMSVEAMQRKWGNVYFAGPQYGGAKLSSFRAADFFVLPSKSEGLPLAVLEAWAAGVPSIITKECNLSEAFGRGAALATGTTVAEISASLIQADRLTGAERQAIADSAQALASSQYSRTAVGRAMGDLYRSCLQHRVGS